MAEHVFAELNTILPLEAAVLYPLPGNFPVSNAGWKVVSGPAPVTFGIQTAKSTIAVFPEAGRYQLQYAISQLDDSNHQNILTHAGAGHITVQDSGSTQSPDSLKIVIGDWT